MAEDLSGQVALVTGGTGSLGRAVTAALIERGAYTYVTYKSQAELAELQQRLSGSEQRFSAIEADVMDEQSVDQVVARVVQERGGIQILAHLVGGYLGGKSVQDTSAAEWQRMIDLNLTSAFLCCHAVLPVMHRQGYGRIVLVSSRAAVQMSTGVSAYTAAKAGVLALAGTIAQENHRLDITANAVLPSIIDTPINRQAIPTAKFEIWPKAEEIAAVIGFLASRESGLISGGAIPVYGKA